MTIHPLLPFTLLMLVLLGSVEAASPADVLEARSFTNGEGAVLHYRILVPTALKPGEKIPLVLFLHGAGERGSNNVSQLHHGIPSILSYLKKQQLPAILIVPQCPVGQQWVDVPWSAKAHVMKEKPSDSMRLVMDLLHRSIRELPVDQQRIYVTGISMGGFGTWDLIQRAPDLFAAALPICGGGDVNQAAKLKDLPIWTFHGGADAAIPPSRSRDMVAALKQAGGRITYTEYPGVGHNAWTRTYDNDKVLAWLFAQKKPD